MCAALSRLVRLPDIYLFSSKDCSCRQIQVGTHIEYSCCLFQLISSLNMEAYA